MKAFFLLLLLVALAVIAAACQSEDANNTTNTTSPPDYKLETECAGDDDCAVAGCSGQICANAEEASGIITTCEYRDEYSCLKYTTCGCIGGSCAWVDTEEYASCLEGIKNK